MSHDLLGERFLGRREPAWHQLGQVFTEPLTASEAAERVGLAEITVEKRPVMVDLGGVMTTFGQFAIVRPPTSDDPQFRVLGTCGEGYGLIQHVDLARKLDPLTKDWPVETMGVLGKGETLFVALDAGPAEIKGDPIARYFLLTDTKDGRTGISLHFTPVRVVCQNTLSMGKAAAVTSAKLRHTANVEAELDWRLDVMKSLQHVAQQSMQSLVMLADFELGDGDLAKILEVAYPLPRTPRKVAMAEALSPEDRTRLALNGLLEAMKLAERNWETTRLRIEERRTAAEELYVRFGDENPQHAGTGWAAYNAVVEMEDYREAAGGEDPYVAALFGQRALTKERAYEATLRLATS